MLDFLRTTKVFREKFKMSQRDFAEYFSIPYGTVKNWDARGCAPVYFIKLCFRFMILKNGGVDDDENGDIEKMFKSD